MLSTAHAEATTARTRPPATTVRPHAARLTEYRILSLMLTDALSGAQHAAGAWSIDRPPLAHVSSPEASNSSHRLIIPR